MIGRYGQNRRDALRCCFLHAVELTQCVVIGSAFARVMWQAEVPLTCRTWRGWSHAPTKPRFHVRPKGSSR